MTVAAACFRLARSTSCAIAIKQHQEGADADRRHPLAVVPFPARGWLMAHWAVEMPVRRPQQQADKQDDDTGIETPLPWHASHAASC